MLLLFLFYSSIPLLDILPVKLLLILDFNLHCNLGFFKSLKLKLINFLRVFSFRRFCETLFLPEVRNHCLVFFIIFKHLIKDIRLSSFRLLFFLLLFLQLPDLIFPNPKLVNQIPEPLLVLFFIGKPLQSLLLFFGPDLKILDLLLQISFFLLTLSQPVF